MRTIYVILLGLILFQGVFIAFSSSFPYSGGLKHEITDPTEDSDLINYDITDPSTFIDNILAGGAIASLIVAAGVIVAIATKNYVVAGMGFFIGIIVGLLSSTWSVVTTINFTSNPIVASITNIIFLAIGFLSLYAVVDMFAPQGAQQ